ncbi:DUF3616 domain-containing protein [Belnapia rosea]|nr:DUF3616 domain-containing protein [Belnapia rosea]
MSIIACVSFVGAASAQQPRAVRQDGVTATTGGTCDASAVVAVPAADPPTWLVANDENESLLAITSAGEVLQLGGGNLQQTLRADDAVLERMGRPDGTVRNVVRRGEADLEGAAWLGDHLYFITSHGRNSSGERRPRRERLAAVVVAPGPGGLAVRHAEGMTRYPHLLRDLAQVPLLSAAIDVSDNPNLDLRPEGRGLNIEGLAAGSDGTSLLIGFRNPLTADRKAILLPLLNPAELRPAPEGPRALFGEPILLDLGGRGIRSIEYVPHRNIYLIVAGLAGDGADFALYVWGGLNQPLVLERLKGDEAVVGDAADPFRPEGLAITADGRRIVLVSDDGDRTFGQQPCKDVQPAGNRSFRIMRLVLE